MKYNNIEDISTTNLWKMLDMDRYQDNDSQKMIKDELKFRQSELFFENMLNIFKEGKWDRQITLTTIKSSLTRAFSGRN